MYNKYFGHVQHLCLRATFEVTDPAKVSGLSLAAEFRGGMIVYLNGHEVARGSLPKGKVTPAIVAADYPPEVSLRPDGAMISWGWGDPGKYKDRLRKRLRYLRDIAIPTTHLPKGTNVLAVGLHRSALSSEFRKLKKYYQGLWNTLGLNGFHLKAEVATGLIPNTARPAGVQVWNANPVLPISQSDYGVRGVAIRPIRIVGTQNGAFCGKVIASSDKPIRGLKAVMGALKQTAGEDSIAPEAVAVRYAVGGKTCDALAAEPPTDARVVPVWIRVSVPDTAPAGDYEGALSIEADGLAKTNVPVALKVHGWRLPAPSAYHTWVDFIESPESVAMAYDVPFWSDKHFERVAQVFRLLGTAGNKTAYVPLIAQSNLGNAETMVRWIKKDDGTYAFDFAPMERYLDTVEKNAGTPDVVVLQVWDVHLPGSWSDRRTPLRVTALDPQTGKTRTMDLPDYTAPAGTALWKPLAKELVERLKKRGLDRKLMLGIFCDGRPAKSVTNYWKETLPGLPWVSQGHGLHRRINGMPVGYCTTVWNAHMAYAPEKRRTYGWRNRQIVAQFPRDMWKPAYGVQLVESRTIGERNITGRQRGFGRMSGDFWNVLKGGRRAAKLSTRYPRASWSQCNLYQTAFLGRGPKGPVSTARFEMLREGVQECEARVFIEKALLDKTARAKLGDELATRLQAVLDNRTRSLINLNSIQKPLARMLYVCSDWQGDSSALYAAAEGAQQALGR